MTTVGEASPDYSDGVMLALYPPTALADALTLPDGLPPGEMHVTVAYLGHADQVDPSRLLAAATALTMRDLVAAQISGGARFTGGDQDVIVALVDSPGLEDLRRDTLAALERADLSVPREHGYTPHLTRTYLDPAEPDPAGRLAPAPVTFTALSVVYGASRTDLPFTGGPRTEAHPIVPYARTAYAQGWAASGGPMTDRVKAGCAAAVEHAARHADQADILEVALHLGHLEGVWARIYQRRDHAADTQTRAVTTAWRQAAHALDIGAGIRALRQNLGLAETADPAQIAAYTAAALAAARSLLAWLPSGAAWQNLRTAMRTLIRTGRAEGAAGALALAADQAGHLGIDFDLAFTHAYDALANLGAIWADADTWLARLLDRQADALGRALADLAAQGASYGDMLDAATALLSDAGNQAVAFITDWALNTALSRGALDLYASEGVGQVDWMDAGDARVCPVCEANAAGSPYPVMDFPQCPAHPRCRCTPAASSWALPDSLAALIGA